MSLVKRLKGRCSKKGINNWKRLSIDDESINGGGELLGVDILESNNDEYDKLINILKPEITTTTAAGGVKRNIIDNNKHDKRKKKKVSNISNINDNINIDNINIDDINIDDMDKWKSISSNIPDIILKALKVLGFIKPTPIQEYSIPPALLPIGNDILAAAETGSGKTLAYGIPLLSNIIYMQQESNNNIHRNKMDGIIIVPTRELAMQVYNHLLKVGKYIPKLLIAPIVGGMSIQKQHRLINKVPNIIVATPGRLAALLGCTNIRNKNDILDKADTEVQVSDKLKNELLGEVRCIVLDEADRLVTDEGHFKDLNRVLDMIYNNTQLNKIQHLIFSATLATETEHITGIVSKREKSRIEKSRKTSGDKMTRLLNKLRLRGENHRNIIDLTKTSYSQFSNPLSSDNTAPSSSSNGGGAVMLPNTLTFEEITVSVDNDREVALVYYLHKRFGPKQVEDDINKRSSNNGKIIMFVNSISYVYRLSSILSIATYDKVKVCGMHSDLKQKDRLKKLEQFKNSSCGVLVTTDLASRGLDLPNVDTVIHVNCPRVLELFIHRSGRTARAGRKGNCIIIRTPSEYGAWKRTLDEVNIKPNNIIINSRDIAFIKHLLLLVNEYEGAQHKEQRENKEKAWMRKMAQDADLPMSDIDDEEDEEEEIQYFNKKGRSESAMKRLKQQSEIKDILATPLPSLRKR